MLNTGKTLLLATLLVPGAALAQINVGDALGTSEDAIRAALQSQGYTASEFEIEDDEIEVEAIHAGQSFEIEISPETGLVLAVEIEGDDDSDDD